MEIRALLAIILSMIILVGFQYFSGNLISPPARQTELAGRQKPGQPEGNQKTATENNPAGQPMLQSQTPAAPSRTARDITVETNLYRIVLSEEGGNLKQCLLKHYAVNIGQGSPPVNLVNTQPPYLPLGIRLGPPPGIDLSNQLFDADKGSLVLNKNLREGRLTFSCKLPNGLEALKTYTFHEGSYWIDLSIRLKGIKEGNATISLYDKPLEAETRYILSGPSYFANGGLNEVKLTKPGEAFNYSGKVDWLGYGDNYFLAALVPITQDAGDHVFIERKDSEGLTASSLTMPVNLDASGGSIDLGLYFGPKEMEILKALNHNLAGSIDFGWFTVIAKPLLYFLNFLYGFTHNYGLAIIVITILIKIAFWPLAYKSAKSMKTMQKLQPKLLKLKEKYGDDKERLNKELMQLYKTFKVNPMSGCLPMLLQIPVFFALYKVLLQSIELRHAPFAFWIKDLSAPDRLMIHGLNIPFIGGVPVLTLLMGASMYMQQKMTPSSIDPTQAKMMQILPVIFTFMFINFPSGLVLYWLVNNMFSIMQQYYINKFTD